MSEIKSIKNIRNLAGKRVLVRVDFNVPVKNGRVSDDGKIRASLPTIEFLVKKKARVILVTHLGRPEGKVVATLRLDPVAHALSKLLGKKVKKLSTGNWKMGKNLDRVVFGVRDMKPGDIVLFDNIRFSPDEQGNKGLLSKQLAALSDVFVLDGFAVAHRADASVSGVAKYLPSYAGLLLEKEIAGLSKVTMRPAHPLVLIIGDAKMETKVPVIQSLARTADAILVGGGIANTMLLARGYGVGDSIVDKEYRKEALGYWKKKKIVAPVDVIVGKKYGGRARRVEIQEKPHTICKKGEAIFDIGPDTVRLFASHIKTAKTLVWNGAMGYFEQYPYETGTLSIARLVGRQSKGNAFGVVGGGETIESMDMVGMTDDVDLVSTGGGAMLEFLTGKKLPGIESLS